MCVPVKRYPETGGLERETGVVCVCFSGGMSKKMPAHQVGVGYFICRGWVGEAENGDGTWRFCTKVTVTAGLFLYGWMGGRWDMFYGVC